MVDLGQPLRQRPGFAALEDLLPVVQQHAERRPVVAGGEQLLDSVLDVPVRSEPLRGLPAEVVHQSGVLGPKLVAEQVGEELVVAEPAVTAVQPGDEQATSLEVGEHRGCVIPARDRIAEIDRQPRQDRRQEQEPASGRVERGEHLLGEVLHHEPVGPRERLDEVRRIVGVLERDRSETQPGSPAVGAVHQDRGLRVRQLRPARGTEQRRGFPAVERQVGPAHLDESALQPQPPEPHRRIPTGRQDEAHVVREALDELLELAQQCGVGHEVQVVEHQDQVGLLGLEFGEQALDERLAEAVAADDPAPGEVGVDRLGGCGQCVQNGPSEHRRVVVAVGEPDGADAQVCPGAGPLLEQHRLARAGRRDHQADAPLAHRVESLLEARTLDERTRHAGLGITSGCRHTVHGHRLPRRVPDLRRLVLGVAAHPPAHGSSRRTSSNSTWRSCSRCQRAVQRGLVRQRPDEAGPVGCRGEELEPLERSEHHPAGGTCDDDLVADGHGLSMCDAAVRPITPCG